MKKALLLFVLICFSVHAQRMSMKGRVIDKIQQKPIPFVSIQAGKVGTITDEEGNFNLILSKPITSLKVSCIGYKTTDLPVSSKNEKLLIQLEPDEVQLQEVFIMPDSGLKVLLRKAYQSIEKNYPTTPFELTGFYREVDASTDKKLAYLSEAVLKVYSSGYQTSQEDAQIEVLKTRTYKSPYRDSIDNVRYYGGAFIANWGDYVKMREDFLNPDNKKYDYELEGITKLDEKLVYLIGFQSRDKQKSLKGKIWIDKQSHAYLKIGYENENPTQNILFSVKKLYRKYETIYTEIDGKWYLKYTNLVGESFNTKTKKPLLDVLIFSTTDFSDENISPIPLNKRLPYSALFSELQNNFQESFWEEYTTTELDSSLKKQVTPTYTVNEIQSLKKQETTYLPQKISTKEYLYKISPKLNFGYMVSVNQYQNIAIPAFSLSYQQKQLANSNPTPFGKPFLSIRNYVGYKLPKTWQMFYEGDRSMSKPNYFKFNGLGISTSLLMKKEGNPLYFVPKIELGILKTGVLIAEMESTNGFIIANKNMGKKVNVYFGEKQCVYRSGLALAYQKQRWQYLIEVNYLQNINSKAVLFLKSPNSIFSKEQNIAPNSNGFSFYNNSNRISIKPFSFSFGVKIGF